MSSASGRRGRCTPSKALSSSGFLLINPRAGDSRPSPEDLRKEASRRGIDVHILKEGDDPAEEARKADAEVLGIAGGDGSLASVAGVALECDVPFVCIPFGTRNHFARDLGLDRDDPLGALAAFDGVERRVDIGAVAERLFLNNVSLGLYASFVHDPERKTRNRVIAFARMVPAALGRSRTPLDLSLDLNGQQQHHAAFVVLVANNDYRIESMADLGERQRLDEGLLHAYVIEAVSRRALLGLLLKAATGDLEEAEGFIEVTAERMTVDLPHNRIHAAIDGEPAVLEAPLEFEMKQRALRVLVPTG